MDESFMPTVITKSLNELERFLNGSNKNNPELQSKKQYSNSSFQGKLNFDESMFDESNADDGSNFQRTHQENIAGLDIAKRVREKDTELTTSKAVVASLDRKIGNLKKDQKLFKMQYEKEVESFRKQQFEDKNVISELNSQLAKTKLETEEIRNELSKMKDKMGNRRASLQNNDEKSLMEKVEIEKELGNAREKLVKLKEELEEKSSSLQLQIVENKCLQKTISESALKSAKLNELQLQVDSFQKKIEKLNNINKELKEKLASTKMDENKTLLGKSISDIQKLKKEILDLKNENVLLKKERVNTELLEERATSSEKLLAMTKRRCDDVSNENATLIELQKLNEEYEVAIKKELKSEEMPPISEFVAFIQDLKHKENQSQQAVSMLTESTKAHEAAKKALEDENKALKIENEKTRDEIERNAHHVRRLQRNIAMITKERNSLKEIISSYESESTVSLSKLDQEKTKRLEEQLEDYKGEISRLQKDLDGCHQLEPVKTSLFPSTSSESKNDSLEIKGLKEENLKLNEKLKKVAEELEKLKEKHENLEFELEQHKIRGSFNPETEKVITFKNNPLEMAYNDNQDKMNKLQKENDALKRRVQLLESGDTEDLTRKIGMPVNKDLGASSEEIKALTEENKSLELRIKRVMDAFQKKSKEMREVVYQLLGYKVDFKIEKKYKLSNIYSDTSQDFLEFEETPDGELQLMETDFSAKIEDLIENYLRQDNSYPAFLSAITLDLFRKQNEALESSDEEIGSDQELHEEDDIKEIDDEDRSSIEFDDEDPMKRHQVDDSSSDLDPQFAEGSECRMDDAEFLQSGQYYDGEESDIDPENEEYDEDPSDYDPDEEDNREDPPSKRFKPENNPPPDDDDSDDLICLD